MNRSSPEIENLVPQISPTHFTKEKSARVMEMPTDSQVSMLELGGNWKVIGWALAANVAPRDLCAYVILCEEDGNYAWCHASHYQLNKIGEKIRENRTKVGSIR